MFEPRNLMPRFPVPEGDDRGVAGSHARSRPGWRAASRPACRRPHVEQAEYEIEVICQMGFPAYFLVVADFIMWAKDNGIAVGPGRGSAAGSHGRVRDGHHRPRPDRRTG